MSTGMILLIIAAVIILGLIVFPFINKVQFKRMPKEQQIRILMKQAKGLSFFKNISDGSKGQLIYIKNKRKIYIYPWILVDGKLLCTRDDIYEKWDYPEENNEFSEDEKALALNDLKEYNKKAVVKLYLNEKD